jgi:hypothetical protein
LGGQEMGVGVGQIYVFDSGIKFTIYQIISIEKIPEIRSTVSKNKIIFDDRTDYIGNIENESIDGKFKSIFDAPYMFLAKNYNRYLIIYKIFGAK